MAEIEPNSLADQTSAIETQIQDIRANTALPAEESGRRLTPLYEKKSALLKQQREAEKPQRDTEFQREVESHDKAAALPPEIRDSLREYETTMRREFGPSY